jgi:hypothetical protein
MNHQSWNGTRYGGYDSTGRGINQALAATAGEIQRLGAELTRRASMSSDPRVKSETERLVFKACMRVQCAQSRTRGHNDYLRATNKSYRGKAG